MQGRPIPENKPVADPYLRLASIKQGIMGLILYIQAL